MREAAASGAYQIAIDLAAETIALPDGKSLAFKYDPFRKHCLLNGLDDIDYILSHQDEISSFRTKQEEIRFYNTKQANR